MFNAVYDLQYGDYQDRMTFHICMGLACGYPLCCVLWFVGTYDFDRKGTIEALENTHMESLEGRKENNSHAICPNHMIKQLVNN